ncbi:hypothetical protein FRB99_000338 [Tulasnella sp. 403]|nr:hypothetical protein FRB99_000338 [Tulasnella sp. 403]
MPAPIEWYPSVVSDIYPGIAPEKYAGQNKGRVVFITGASKGLGLESAKAYAATGASLFLSARTTHALEQAKTDIETTYKVPVAIATVDVSDEASVKAGVDEAVKAFGRIDIVIANAVKADRLVMCLWRGGGKPMSSTSKALIPSQRKYLLSSSFHRPLIALPSHTMAQLRKNKGYIILLSSVLSQMRIPGNSIYNVAKLSLIRLAEWIALGERLEKKTDLEGTDNGAAGVKAFAMHPGSVVTDLSALLIERQPHLKAIFKDSPQLGPWTQVRLTSGSEDWLSGRFFDATWDLDEINKYKEQILEEDALKIRLALPRT